jgi:hypothetical protein
LRRNKRFFGSLRSLFSAHLRRGTYVVALANRTLAARQALLRLAALAFSRAPAARGKNHSIEGSSLERAR